MSNPNDDLPDYYVEVVNDSNALLYLVRYRCANRVRELIEKGGNVNIEDDDGASPACWAAKNNDFEMLKILAEAGADLTAGFVEMLTPLYWAEHHNNQPMLDYITQRIKGTGANPA